MLIVEAPRWVTHSLRGRAEAVGEARRVRSDEAGWEQMRTVDTRQEARGKREGSVLLLSVGTTWASS